MRFRAQPIPDSLNRLLEARPRAIANIRRIEEHDSAALVTMSRAIAPEIRTAETTGGKVLALRRGTTPRPPE